MGSLLDFFKTIFRPMIVKPPNWFCGIGIKLINKIGEENHFNSELDNFFLLFLRGDSEQEEQDVRPEVH